MPDKPQSIVQQMYQNDAYSQWLGIDIVKVTEGNCTCRLTVRKDMTNGFGIAHGGITYALADSTLAFASNSSGRQSVSVETSISHLLPLSVGDIITATSECISDAYRIGVYVINIKDQNNQLVASFKGTVYKKSENWEID